MKDSDFKELCKSVKQAGEIVRGEIPASRITNVEPSLYNVEIKIARKGKESVWLLFTNDPIPEAEAEELAGKLRQNELRIKNADILARIIKAE